MLREIIRKSLFAFISLMLKQWNDSSSGPNLATYAIDFHLLFSRSAANEESTIMFGKVTLLASGSSEDAVCGSPTRAPLSFGSFNRLSAFDPPSTAGAVFSPSSRNKLFLKIIHCNRVSSAPVAEPSKKIPGHIGTTVITKAPLRKQTK